MALGIEGGDDRSQGMRYAGKTQNVERHDMWAIRVDALGWVTSLYISAQRGAFDLACVPNP